MTFFNNQGLLNVDRILLNTESSNYFNNPLSEVRNDAPQSTISPIDSPTRHFSANINSAMEGSSGSAHVVNSFPTVEFPGNKPICSSNPGLSAILFDNQQILFHSEANTAQGSPLSFLDSNPPSPVPTKDQNGNGQPDQEIPSLPIHAPKIEPSNNAGHIHVNARQNMGQQNIPQKICSHAENNVVRGQESEVNRADCPELSQLYLPSDQPLDCRARLIVATSVCLALLPHDSLKEVASKVMDKMPPLVRNRLTDWAIDIEKRFFFAAAPAQLSPDSVQEGMGDRNVQESVGVGTPVANRHDGFAHGMSTGVEGGSAVAYEKVAHDPEKMHQVPNRNVPRLKADLQARGHKFGRLPTKASPPPLLHEQTHGNYLQTRSCAVPQGHANVARELTRVSTDVGAPSVGMRLVKMPTAPSRRNNEVAVSDEKNNIPSFFPDGKILRDQVLDGMAEWGKSTSYAVGTAAPQVNMTGKRSRDPLSLDNAPEAKRAELNDNPSQISNGLSAAQIISRKWESLRREREQEGMDLMEQTLNNTQVLGPSSGPSRFCHLCTRSGKPEILLKCNNYDRGVCRKVICHRCIREHGWDLEKLRKDESWVCTHCNKKCPTRAQCYTYKRVNQHRRSDGKGKKKICDNS